ncbi:hypothetical protein TELCIR_10110 [Teladorsagia circumcincta]|uniref:Thioredoxin domain-containing protein n=1 Tax=Teladorsagia circumcincta TaxID=45464 RepID=A0A2G9UD06_TELCI|nr:hypothetical protein TELCIR_10110 [Teladorsagia circumcincta]
MVHSVPNFPPVEKYDYPETGSKYAQSFICLSLGANSLEDISQYMRYSQVTPYIANLPKNFEIICFGTISNSFMMKLLLIIAATWVPALSEKKSSKSDLSNGFRTEIDWVEWDKAVGVAKDLNKPIFLLIHKTWCGACKGLKREFTTSSKMPELIELSEKFVMVNVEDDEEPEDDKYAPDGGYIPRILFLGREP